MRWLETQAKENGTSYSDGTEFLAFRYWTLNYLGAAGERTTG